MLSMRLCRPPRGTFCLNRRSSVAALLVALTVGVALLATTPLRQASAQTPIPAISIYCPEKIGAIAQDAGEVGTAECTLTASPAATSTLTVHYQVSGAGARTIKENPSIAMTGGTTTIRVPYLHNTTDAVTVSIQPGAGYALGTPSTAAITVGAWVSIDPRPPVGMSVNKTGALDGYLLLTSAFHNKHYLIDNQGRVAYEWAQAGMLSRLLGDGKLLVGKTDNGGVPGSNIAELNHDGTEALAIALPHLHHDVLKLADGNYMYIDSDFLPRDDAIAAGANPACLPAVDPELAKQPGIELDSIVVVDSDGVEVWRWDVRDHLIQDFDSSKANYGVVADHPERVDLNYGLCRQHASFNNFLKSPHHLTHLNSIDYNAELDQIMITSRHFSEVWVIDASTTTAQAATDTDGTYGQGGRLLYRAGNPRAHRAGDKHDQTLFFPHNAHWIPAGLPGAGNVLVYNNGFEHPGFRIDWASVDEWVLPEVGGEYVQVGSGYMAPATVWSYFMPERTWLMSNAQRLSNGNTLVVEGEHGRITEVTPGGEVVWHYRSPLMRGTGVWSSRSEPSDSSAFWIYRSYKYPSDYAGIEALTLVPEQDRNTLEGARAAQPVISIAGGGAVTEGNDVTFTLTADPTPAAALTVNVSVAQDGDFGATGPQTVTMPATGAVTLTISTTGDGVEEDDGSVTATVDAGSGYTVSTTAGSASVTIEDDDGGACTPNLPGDAITVSEVKTWRDEFTHAEHVQRWNRVLAALGEDTGQEPMTANDAATIKQQFDNTRWDRTVRTLTAMEECSAQPEVSIAGDGSVTEGGTATFTLTANPPPASPLNVSVAVSQVGDFGVTPSTQTVTIATTGSGTLTVATGDDSVDEPDGSVTATVSSGTGYTVSSSAGSATVAVNDDDDPPPATPEISIAAGSGITEGGHATFTLTANPAPASPLNVSVAVSQTGDFGVTPGSRTVSIGTSGRGTLTVATADDSHDEANGSVSATINSGTGYTVSTSNSATVAVADDDIQTSGVTASVSDASGNEGDRTVAFTVTLSKAAAHEIRIRWDTQFHFGAEYPPYPAYWGDDFWTIDGEHWLVFAPGETNKTAQVHLEDDNSAEPTEVFLVRLLEASGASIADDEGLITIIDND